MSIDDIDNHLKIIGDYIQLHGEQVVSNLSMTIVSESESENGQLNVTGKAVFDGQLTITKSENMVFKLDQAFQIVKADSIEGSFSSMSLPELSADLAWDTSSLYQNGTLKIAKATYIKPPISTTYIYPNPAPKSSSISVQYKLDQSTDTTLEIYNMFGHKLFSTNYAYNTNGGKINQNNIEINNSYFRNWPIGVYFIIVHNGNDTLAKGKFSLK